MRAGGDVDDDGGVLHGDDEEDVLVARVELHPQHRRREPEPLKTEGQSNRMNDFGLTFALTVLHTLIIVYKGWPIRDE